MRQVTVSCYRPYTPLHNPNFEHVHVKHNLVRQTTNLTVTTKDVYFQLFDDVNGERVDLRQHAKRKYHRET